LWPYPEAPEEAGGEGGPGQVGPGGHGPPVYALVYTWDGSRPVEFDWDEANTAHIARHGVRPGSQRRGPGPLPDLHPAAGQGAGDHRPGRHPRGEAAVPKEG
jgi:hypothetical protein